MSDSLKQQIIQAIHAAGPISIAQYMHLCNSHPEHGYYATGNPLGKSGDFITAPEISQMFGELISVWCIAAWRALGCPNPIQIAELGPGRGTLMADFLRTTKNDKDFFDAMEIKLVETSPSLKKQQQELIADTDANIEWCKTIENLPATPTLFIANEFLDAIPFRQFIKTDGKWLELCVGIHERAQNDQLDFVVGTTGIDEKMLPSSHQNEPDGAIFETAPAREAIVANIAAHIKKHCGAALFIDYGHEYSGFGDTFQAVQSHQSVSTLANPGNSDLTSHVDFQAIDEVAKDNGAEPAKLLTQSDFLLKLGLLERAGVLGHNKSARLQKQIENDVERLVSPEQMGELFKVLCLAQPGCHLPLFGS